MTFPLGDWIDEHEGCRYNLGESGMKGVVGPVRPSERATRSADPTELRRVLADALGVAAPRVFLTHGATEGNGAVMQFVRADLRGATRALRCRVLWPEYPPLPDTARWAGFRVTSGSGPSALAVISNPRNPEGRWIAPPDLEEWARDAHDLLVDETFREFARVPTFSGRGRAGVWRTGTFTKFFGGDAIRVGWVVVPDEARDRFARFHRLFIDPIPPYSVASALATWKARAQIRRQVGEVFERNRGVVRATFPDLPPLAAPVFFDRPVRPDGRALAMRCLRASVLVCPGDFFGDRRGVRIGLTRPTFARDLRAYLRIRDRPGSRRR